MDRFTRGFNRCTSAINSETTQNDAPFRRCSQFIALFDELNQDWYKRGIIG
ncbi:unnamed protein product [Acidithrix sp. C25]|nr:unnamed protein product [Acidithrix sp. C25]